MIQPAFWLRDGIEKATDFLPGFTGLGELRVKNLPDMHHVRPALKLDRGARSVGLVHITAGIIQQHFRLTRLDQGWWQV